MLQKPLPGDRVTHFHESGVEDRGRGAVIPPTAHTHPDYILVRFDSGDEVRVPFRLCSYEGQRLDPRCQVS